MNSLVESGPMRDSHRAPVIGVTACKRESSFGPWNLEAVILPSGYTTAIEEAGGKPLVLPPGCCSSLLDLLDGLVRVTVRLRDSLPVTFGAEYGVDIDGGYLHLLSHSAHILHGMRVEALLHQHFIPRIFQL